MKVTKSLAKLLTSPSKVAQALDWRSATASVLSLSITRDRIHLAVANHPSSSEAQSLPSIPVKTEVVDGKRQLSRAVADELASIMSDWKVCGLVVNWPVQKEGWCGAHCGRVLFTLDQLVKREALSSKRPVCLWDEEHHVAYEDEWGRAPIYGRPASADKDVHVASQEQYKEQEHVAADIWSDFCKAHWPELYYYQPSVSEHNTLVQGSAASKRIPVPEKPPTVNLEIKTDWLDSYEDTSAYTKATL